MNHCRHKRYTVNVVEQTGFCLDCRKDGREMFVTTEESVRANTIEAAAQRAVLAFEALGNAQNAGAMLIERGNCETAMVALKAALYNTEGGHHAK